MSLDRPRRALALTLMKVRKSLGRVFMVEISMVKPPDKPVLSVINRASSGVEPPRKLGEHGMALWNAVQSEYRIDDVGGIELLAQACAAVDRIEALAAAIERDGETVRTKTGIKAHPALRDELAGRAFVCRTLDRLGVTTESIKPIGRPPKSYGWRG